MPISHAELERAIKRAFAIPGLYRRGESAFLYRLARRRGSIVEIGCWQGRTTSLLVMAAGIWGAKVTTVDPFTPMPARHKQSSPELWRHNLGKAGIIPPPLLQMTSHEAVSQAPSPLAMVFIDGDHAQDAVAQDLTDWTPLIQIGGVLALHDMFYPTIPGVIQAVADWWVDRREAWTLVGLADFTVAFKRVL